VPLLPAELGSIVRCRPLHRELVYILVEQKLVGVRPLWRRKKSAVPLAVRRFAVVPLRFV